VCVCVTWVIFACTARVYGCADCVWGCGVWVYCVCGGSVWRVSMLSFVYGMGTTDIAFSSRNYMPWCYTFSQWVPSQMQSHTLSRYLVSTIITI